jgi:hypothetical protein
LVEPGNAFPCDFSKPPQVRDAVCSPGDVCGVDNRCQRYVYEGPQFEGLPTFPDFADAGTQLHPALLRGPIDVIARAALNVQNPSPAVIVHSSRGYFRVDVSPPSVTPLDLGPGVPERIDDVVFLRREDATVVVARSSSAIPQNDNVVFSSTSRMNRVADGAQDLRALRIRLIDAESSQLAVLTTGPETRVGTIRTVGPRDEFEELGRGVALLDVAAGPPLLAARGRLLTVLASDGIRSLAGDGGTQLVLGRSFPAASLLQSENTGTAFAVLSFRGGPQTNAPVLATYQVTRTGQSLTLDVPFSDCVPCSGNVLALTPGLDVDGVFVDVLCAAEGLKRVRGASTREGPCLAESQPAPFDVAQVAERPRRFSDGTSVLMAVQDFGGAGGFVAGGKNGEVWVGRTIGDAVPFLLDRVPKDVSSSADGLTTFALTNAGLYVRTNEQGFILASANGRNRIAALVAGSQGWAVDGEGHLSVPVGRTIRFGPRLVDGRGDAVSRVLSGEGFTNSDGGLVSMLIAADDSLYFIPTPEAPSGVPGVLGEVTPQLTPEPSVLIRNFALERSPLGSNGVDRMRGYVVTSRNVYEFKLGGRPLQWNATPLRLSAAEPVEVWFDNPRGGLARAGYRDGTVFSIPGGFELVTALPETDGGVAAAVLDYENLGGWPVALATTGLFVAQYDRRPDNGRLDNRFSDGGVNKPMTWREVALPDGTRPWLTFDRRLGLRSLPGKLHVVAEPQQGSDRAYRRTFRLLLFLPDRVLEVGRHTRTNVSVPE